MTFPKGTCKALKVKRAPKSLQLDPYKVQGKHGHRKCHNRVAKINVFNMLFSFGTFFGWLVWFCFVVVLVCGFFLIH